ncbi:hypothetical protein [Shewanella pealeana]|uniref:Fimbrial protein n=1 Tax=Shewanella pealeana (strain ATCC 700345 / ANG-SQ1) TaxID=398579 RepID=A8H639_SHEPA|nr:hypothetical protein [Shewanella pealeana]ABV88026.1 hypothetical protein Spea_2706 [Shewanella pealeana ATCC 700345]
MCFAVIKLACKAGFGAVLTPFAHFSSISLCLLLGASLPVSAFTINGTLTGDKLEWANASSDGAYIRPNYWFTPTRLPETTMWVPGTYTSPTQMNIELSSGAEHVSMPIKLTGVKYQLGGQFSQSPYADIYPACERSTIAATSTVMSTSHNGFCIANKSIQFDSPTTPFKRYQPVIRFDKTELIRRLKGKGKGIYSGTVTGVISYGFKANISEAVKTYRNIPITFSMQIAYNPSVISRINVLGNGHMTPKYDTYKHTVSGHTGFKVSVLGQFQNGLKFRLINKDADDYSLKPDSGGATEIPYSISCQGCSSQSELVADGQVVEKGQAQIDAPGASMIPFMLNVGYENVSVNDVEEQRYSDNFTLMFEVLL